MANSGNRGKFAEWIKKITFRKRVKKKYEEDENYKVIYNNVLKILALVPGMVYSNLKNDEFEVMKKRTLEQKKENNKKFVLVDKLIIIIKMKQFCFVFFINFLYI